MKPLNILIALLIAGNLSSIFTDTSRVYIEYEHSSADSQRKMIIKLYKDGDRYKLWRKLTDLPDERAVKTTYIDINANSVVTILEKDGVKKGIKTVWDKNYSVLVADYNILFRGLPEGHSFDNFTKFTGTEIVLGRECELYESGLSIIGATTKYYMWNGIMLKAVAPDYTTSAILINDNPVFSADEFTVPADVSWN